MENGPKLSCVLLGNQGDGRHLEVRKWGSGKRACNSPQGHLPGKVFGNNIKLGNRRAQILGKSRDTPPSKTHVCLIPLTQVSNLQMTLGSWITAETTQTYDTTQLYSGETSS